MEEGFQTRNTKGVIQVDSKDRNFLLIKSGQFTFDGRYPVDLWERWKAEQPNGQTAASIMLVRTADGRSMRPTTGGYIDGKKFCNFGYIRSDANTFQYYMFDLVAPSLSDTLGLQTFDAKGNLSYNALDYPLRIMYASRQYRDTVFTAPHSNFAYGVLSGGKDVNNDAVDVECYYTYIYAQGNTVKVDVIYDEFGNPEGAGVGNYGDAQSTIIIADVTNIPKNWSRQ